MKRRTVSRLVVSALAALGPAACRRGAPAAPPAQAAAVAGTAAAAPQPAGVVDSVFPMEVMLERFGKEIPEVKTLEHGASTRDELVQRVIAALQASDTTAFEGLAVSLPEFAWLYFPTSATAQPPYELPPGLAWFRVQEANRKGVFRALRELGGHALRLNAYACKDAPVVEGKNRLWTGCRITIVRDHDEPVSIRLFDSILERDGRFAVLSYANDF